MAKKLTKLVLALGLLFFPLAIFAQNTPPARKNVTNWYIKDFNSTIIVYKDSTLDITEDIIADCGEASGKHGIFRILPERIKLDDGKIFSTPVELISITDFSGQEYKFSQSRDFSDKTITWKIGDPDMTVQGVNNYRIHYKVKNAIRFNEAFDELYWNLNGNFWDLETDRFRANIIFPSEVTKENSQVDYYSGLLGSKSKDLAAYKWRAPNTLEFVSTGTLGLREGITASIIFPKNIFIPYRPGFFEAYGNYLWFLLPLAVFFFCLRFWQKYGKDPKVDKTIIPEYGVPGELTPLEMGMLITNGRMPNKLITAEIISLAAKKLITIKEIDSKILVFHSKDYELIWNHDYKREKLLTPAQKAILDRIFGEGDTIKLSTLKNEFYTVLADIAKKTNSLLEEKGLVAATGRRYNLAMIIGGSFLFFGSMFLAGLSIYLAISNAVSALIIVIFGIFMPKRTLAGAELNWQIKGFKLFKETVDKHRAEFYEKENIFEKFLPYAIVFGITGLWIKKMKEIYGEDFYRTHAMAWYVGSAQGFDADSFTNSINSLSSAIAASTSSPSGGHGSGGSGGGGGGGGGGGW